MGCVLDVPRRHERSERKTDFLQLQLATSSLCIRCQFVAAYLLLALSSTLYPSLAVAQPCRCTVLFEKVDLSVPLSEYQEQSL